MPTYRTSSSSCGGSSWRTKILHSTEPGVSSERYCDHDIVISLTTYGRRPEDVCFTIESLDAADQESQPDHSVARPAMLRAAAPRHPDPPAGPGAGSKDNRGVHPKLQETHPGARSLPRRRHHHGRRRRAVRLRHRRTARQRLSGRTAGHPRLPHSYDAAGRQRQVEILQTAGNCVSATRNTPRGISSRVSEECSIRPARWTPKC